MKRQDQYPKKGRRHDGEKALAPSPMISCAGVGLSREARPPCRGLTPIARICGCHHRNAGHPLPRFFLHSPQRLLHSQVGCDSNAARAERRVRSPCRRSEQCSDVARLERSDSCDHLPRLSLRSMRATEVRPTMLISRTKSPEAPMDKPNPIPDEHVTQILEVGRWAMSGANGQPWDFIVVKDPETKKQLFRAYIEENNDFIYWMEQQREFKLRHPSFQMTHDEALQKHRNEVGWS